MIYLSWCGLEERVACALGIVLRRNDTLRKLDLSHNGIGPEGALAIASALSANLTLTDVDLSWNPLGERGVAALLSRGVGTGRTISLNNVQPSLQLPARRPFD